MTIADWILDIVLILVVLRQIRWSRIDLTTVLLPLGIVAFVAHKYLGPIPTGGNDILVIGALAALGTVLGIAGGLTTHMQVDQSKVFVRAGFIAASLWILSMGGRLALVLRTEHGGGPTLMRFSEQHQITSAQTWVSTLILMVLYEVSTRVRTIVIRVQITKRTTSQATPAAQATTSVVLPSAPAVTTSTTSPFAPAVTTFAASPSVAAAPMSVASPSAPAVTTPTTFPSMAARPIDRSRGSDSVTSSREVFESLSR